MTESSTSVRDAISRMLGDMAVVLEPPEQLAGCRLSMRVEPRDGEALSTALRTLDSGCTPAIVIGHGSKMGLGNPARGAQVALSCARIAGVEELDAADGVVRVAAGTPIAELDQAARSHGWQVPLDPPGAGATVGGTLAAAAAGPRRLGFGVPRDCVLGLDTVLASGARTRCGGRVVKNVTGYDLAKLYVGSLGTLGVIESAWLRLTPAPRSTRVVASALSPESDPHAIALAAARHSAARAVALVSADLVAAHLPSVVPVRDPAGWLLVAEFTGDEAASGEGAEQFADRAPVSNAEESAIDALRALQGYVAPLGVRARLHVRPSRLPACCASLRGAAAQLLVYPEPGIVYAYFEPSGHDEEDPWWLDGVFAALEQVRGAVQSELVVEELPEWARGRRDVFFGGSGGLSLMRAIKARFDPEGILNPGRFVGSI
jgi:glycolate oxidase FAD binding subunit